MLYPINLQVRNEQIMGCPPYRPQDEPISHIEKNPSSAGTTAPVIIFLFSWFFAVPWIASTAFIYIHGCDHASDLINRLVALPICGLLGLVGVVYSLLVTVPIALLVSALLVNFPSLITSKIFQWGLNMFTSTVGFLWSMCFVNGFTPESKGLLLTIGTGAGLSLGVITLRCWGRGRRVP